MGAGPKKRALTTGTLVGTRFQADLLDAIDYWRKTQPDLPTRPEAVRRLVVLGMSFEDKSECEDSSFNTEFNVAR